MRTGLPIRPVVIAHRGASGYLPEHTLPAKALAYTMGADYLEQDIVASKDDQLIVLHDIHLDRVTNVASAFPDRHRDDGRFYVRDFTLPELKTLLVHERTNSDGSPVYPARFQSDAEEFRVHTFTEELKFIENLQDAVGRPVGIYPEIKRPAWHQEEGVDISLQVLDELANAGYNEHRDPVYLQCFHSAELIRIRESLDCDLKLIQLIGSNDWQESPTDYDYLQTRKGLSEIARSIDGIGPWINQLYSWDESSDEFTDSGLVAMAHALGLAVHPYTMRKDDLPPGFVTFDELLLFLYDDLNVDGVFTDFPDLVLN